MTRVHVGLQDESNGYGHFARTGASYWWKIGQTKNLAVQGVVGHRIE